MITENSQTLNEGDFTMINITFAAETTKELVVHVLDMALMLRGKEDKVEYKIGEVKLKIPKLDTDELVRPLNERAADIAEKLNKKTSRKTKTKTKTGKTRKRRRTKSEMETVEPIDDTAAEPANKEIMDEFIRQQKEKREEGEEVAEEQPDDDLLLSPADETPTKTTVLDYETDVKPVVLKFIEDCRRNEVNHVDIIKPILVDMKVGKVAELKPDQYAKFLSRLKKG